MKAMAIAAPLFWLNRFLNLCQQKIESKCLREAGTGKAARLLSEDREVTVAAAVVRTILQCLTKNEASNFHDRFLATMDFKGLKQQIIEIVLIVQFITLAAVWGGSDIGICRLQVM